MIDSEFRHSASCPGASFNALERLLVSARMSSMNCKSTTSKNLISSKLFISPAAIFLILHFLTPPSSVSETTIDKHKVDLFCTNQTSAALLLSDKISHSITTLIGLFVLQSAISIGFIAFITLGLIYLDDNSLEHDSPALIGK